MWFLHSRCVLTSPGAQVSVSNSGCFVCVLFLSLFIYFLGISAPSVGLELKTLRSRVTWSSHHPARCPSDSVSMEGKWGATPSAGVCRMFSVCPWELGLPAGCDLGRVLVSPRLQLLPRSLLRLVLGLPHIYDPVCAENYFRLCFLCLHGSVWIR